MNKIRITPSKIKGEVTIPPSKSMSHRAIICAALAEGKSTISNVLLSDDINATIEGLRALGADIIINMVSEQMCTLDINGIKKLSLRENTIDCKESGSTIRFLIPLGCLVDDEVIFTGRGKLVERPLKTYYNIFDNQGIVYKTENGLLPLSVKGKLRAGRFEIPGNISSQFITGLLFALPLLEEDSTIVITSELESKGYVDLTLDMLKRFGIDIKNNDYREFVISGNQSYRANDYRVEGDFSQVAFFVVGGLIGDGIDCLGLDKDSKQGDKAVIDIAKAMGGRVEFSDDRLIITPSETKGTVIDGSQCPDIIPVLAVLAALSKGETRIVKAERLRIKESDRLKAIKTELCKLGAKIEETHDGLIINGVDGFNGAEVDSWNDHRIAMSMAMASIASDSELTLTGANAVTKSYPNFWEDFIDLGGEIHE